MRKSFSMCGATREKCFPICLRKTGGDLSARLIGDAACDVRFFLIVQNRIFLQRVFNPKFRST
jgi:hypothetical protein